MNNREAISDRTIENAEIIFAEIYYFANGQLCPRDILKSAFDTWKTGSPNLPMVEAAVSAAMAVEKGTIRVAVDH